MTIDQKPVIRITDSDRRIVTAAATAAYPAECCGLLVGFGNPGSDLSVTDVIESPNIVAHERLDRFEVDPRVRFAVMRRFEGTGRQIIGHYHSHPDGEPVPSATDRSMVFEPALVWLIAGVHSASGSKPGQSATLRAWLFDQLTDDFVELTIKD